MKIGTLQNVIVEPLSTVFESAAQLGFDGVELDWSEVGWAQPGGRLGPENRDAIRLSAERASVEIPSVAAHFLSKGGLTVEGKEAFALEALRAGIALCADLGAGYLLVPFFDAGVIADERASSRPDQESEAAGARSRGCRRHTRDRTHDAERCHGGPSGQGWVRFRRRLLGYGQQHGAWRRSPEEIAQLGKHIVRVHAKEYQQGGDPPGSTEALHFDGLNRRPFGEGDVPVSASWTA